MTTLISQNNYDYNNLTKNISQPSNLKHNSLDNVPYSTAEESPLPAFSYTIPSQMLIV